jgi:hypothetical protein
MGRNSILTFIIIISVLMFYTGCGDADGGDDAAPPGSGRPTPINQCAHSPFVTGVALDPACDPIVACVCSFDAGCCNRMNLWDGECVFEAECVSSRVFGTCSCDAGCDVG